MIETRFAYGSMEWEDIKQHNQAYNDANGLCDKLKKSGKDAAVRRDSLSHEYVVTEFESND